MCSTSISVTGKGRVAGDVALLGDRLPHSSGEHRHVDVPDTEVGDGVDDGVHEGGRAAHAGALADALGADGVVGTGSDDLVQLPLGSFPGGGQQVVHVVGADAVTARVEGDELHVRHGEGL